ncbi:MAG: methionyl-tRNA formyltransferase [Candidatus Nitrosotenuis sp.]
MVRIGFIGCHQISWACLKKICQCSIKYGDEVVLAFDLELERAMKYSASVSLDDLSKEYGFQLFHVSNVADSENIELLKKANLDILFIIGWHRIVPQEVLDVAKIRLGIHSSILPKDRGPSPINWQLIRGEKEGGITLFHLTTGVDEGNIVDYAKYEILESDDVSDVYLKATNGAIQLLENNWKSIHDLQIKSIPQDNSKATVNQRRKPEDGLIDWSKNSKQCYDWIRALTRPYPGAFTYWNGKKALIWKARISDEKETRPGQILNCDDKIIISTGSGSIELLELQIEGEPPCNPGVFSRTLGLKKNEFFCSTSLQA